MRTHVIYLNWKSLQYERIVDTCCLHICVCIIYICWHHTWIQYSHVCMYISATINVNGWLRFVAFCYTQMQRHKRTQYAPGLALTHHSTLGWSTCAYQHETNVSCCVLHCTQKMSGRISREIYACTNAGVWHALFAYSICFWKMLILTYLNHSPEASLL